MEPLSKYKPYPAYKPSGVEWLGEIPAHWEANRLKHLVSMRAGTGITSTEIEEIGEYPVFGGNGIRGYTSSFTHDGKHPLIGRQGALCGAINLASGKFWATEHAVVVDTGNRVSTDCLAYTLMAMSLNQYSQSAAQPGLNIEAIGNILTPAPPLPEQKAIAGFLDRETAKIDALVSRKERLIELLREKRTALITRTVTRGLDPNAPLKDSGVEWLGEIPAHWEVKRLKYLATLNDEALPETTDPDMEITYVDIGNVDSVEGITGAQDLVFEDAPSRARRIVRQGDVIISTVRTYLKAIARIEPTDANLIVSTGFAVIRPRKLDDGFVAYALSSPYFVDRVVAHSVGMSYPAINASELACLDIAFPPLPEQQAIAGFLDRETAKLDSLTDKVNEAIERLRELRTALISAAVTGRIDVGGTSG